MKTAAGVLPGLLLFAVCLAQAQDSPPEEGKRFMLKPIGSVHREDDRTTLVLEKEVAPALLGLDGFSHVWVIWWFDRNDTPQKRAMLQVHPRGQRENPLTGVFACRAPVRPNPIALTLCRVLSVTNNVVEVDKIDAFPGTPILDLKPYTRGNERVDATGPAWLKRGRRQD
jgi:tRNA-Thr(GGU) m(6)t(6)A37 methyltransferase TsaA